MLAAQINHELPIYETLLSIMSQPFEAQDEAINLDQIQARPSLLTQWHS